MGHAHAVTFGEDVVGKVPVLVEFEERLILRRRGEAGEPVFVEEPGALGVAGDTKRVGLATFSGIAASQLGIGPAIDPIRETAKNTAKIADLVARSGAVPTVATSDRSLVNPAEKTAAGIETLVGLTRQLLAKRGGLEFA